MDNRALIRVRSTFVQQPRILSSTPILANSSGGIHLWKSARDWQPVLSDRICRLQSEKLFPDRIPRREPNRTESGRTIESYGPVGMSGRY